MKNVFGFLIALASFSALIGCANHISAKQSDAEYVSKQAQSMQTRGLMSSQDYVQFARISDIVGAKRKLDDKNFDQLMELMQADQPTTQHYASRHVTSNHVTAMALFRNMSEASPDQKQRMVDAVTPLLTSPYKYERIVAKQVIAKYSGSH